MNRKTEKTIKINETESTPNHEYYILNKKHKNLVKDEDIQKNAEWISAEKITEDYLLLEVNPEGENRKYKMVEIMSVKDIEDEKRVYDLHVEDDNSYTVAENIAVHNSVCQTRLNTGVGVPQLGLLDELRECIPDICLISDGGIKSTGDIAKALKFADAVMVGSMISGTSETPGNVYENEKGQFYKTYGGSASAENKVKSGNANQFIEGVMKTVPFRGHVKHILRKIKQNLQSSFSYSGAWNIKEFHEKSEFIFITGSGKSESKL